MALDPTAQHFSLDNLVELRDSSSSILERLREKMLEPHPRKQSPEFSGAQLAALCGVDAKQVPHLATSRKLPPGSHPGKASGNGQRRFFTVADVRAWVNKLANIPGRPAGVRGVTISVVNFKGGSTKTTTAFNLAQGLSLRGRRVLIVDLDPQASATTLTGMLPAAEVSEEQTASMIFHKPLSVAPKDLHYAVQATYWDGIDIIPAAPDLFNAEIFLPMHAQEAGVEWWAILSNAIEPLRAEYDVIIFDTAPSLSYLAVNAVIASDGLVMPLPPENLDYASSIAFWELLAEMLRLIETRGFRKDFEFMRVLVSRMDSTSLSSSLVRDWILATYGKYVLPVEIPKSEVTKTGAMTFGTVYDISRYSGSAKTYAKVRLAYDRFVEMIDMSIVSIWQAREKDAIK